MSSFFRKASDSFTRPANTDAYADNDLVANSTTAASVVPLEFDLGSAGSFRLRRGRISFDSETVTNAQFELYLYDEDPTGTVLSNGDNGALDSIEAGFIGKIPITVAEVFQGSAVGSGVPAADTPFVTTGPKIYGLLKAKAAYTGVSGTIFSVDVFVESGEVY